MSYNIVLEAEEKYNSLQTQEAKNEMLKDTFLQTLLRNLEDYGIDILIKCADVQIQHKEGLSEVTYKNFKKTYMQTSVFVNTLFNKLNDEIYEYNGNPLLNIVSHFQSAGLGGFERFAAKYDPTTDTMTFMFRRKFNY
jgi:hypothetical protein